MFIISFVDRKNGFTEVSKNLGYSWIYPDEENFHIIMILL